MLAFVAVVWLGNGRVEAAERAKLTGTIYTRGANGLETVWPNARVTLKNVVTGAAVATVSSALGEYTFTPLDPGSYEVKVSLAGFAEETKQIEIAAGVQARLDFALHPKAEHQEVVVKAEAEGVNVTSTSVAGPTISQQALQSLPLVNQQFEDALPLLPGVVRGPDGLINIKGARASESATLVNSASVVDPVTGQSAISLPLEAVESVKVLPNPFSAQYGQFAGGITEVETRGGTNQWKFLLTDFFPRIRVRDGTIAGLESATPRLTVAGPLEKDKLFLLQSFQYRFVRTPVPSLPTFERDTVYETFDSYSRLDWNISANQLLTASVSAYPQNLQFVNLNTFNPQPTTPDFRQRGYFVALNERAIFSGGGFLESLFSTKRYDAHVWPATIGAGPFTLFPEQNRGNWYNVANRESRVYEWRQIYHMRPIQGHGAHLLMFGYSYDRGSFEGNVANAPVLVLREDGTLAQRVTFTGPGTLGKDQNTLAGFVNDQWSLLPRLTLNLGFRVDRQDITRDTANLAPRAAFVVSPFRNNRTAIRGGVGLFYNRVPLDLGSFLAYPAETVTQFGSDGATILEGPTKFVHELASAALHVPYSLTWDFQFDHEFGHALMFRFGYEQRKTHRDFMVNPVAATAKTPAALLLLNTGREDYREFQWTLRWNANARTTIFASYVRSHATGELNNFEQFFGNYPNPIVRANEHGPEPFDAPNRFLFWGAVGLPWRLSFSPLLDIHTGFPFSKLDNNLNFVGPRNEGGRFPAFGSLDIQLTREFKVRVLGRTYRGEAGVKIFNATNNFNPRDVQGNVFSPNFGAFYNSVGRQFRAKLEFAF